MATLVVVTVSSIHSLCMVVSVKLIEVIVLLQEMEMGTVCLTSWSSAGPSGKTDLNMISVNRRREWKW